MLPWSSASVIDEEEAATAAAVSVLLLSSEHSYVAAVHTVLLLNVGCYFDAVRDRTKDRRETTPNCSRLLQ